MLKVCEASSEVDHEAAPWDAEALAVLREIAAAALAMPRDGETYRFGADRAEVEIVLGFRPGLDRVVLSGTARVLTCEDAGSVALIDASRRRIILQGLKLAELSAGDIAIG